MTIRILLVDDHRIVRSGIAALLQRERDFELVAEAENGQEAVRLARQLRPDVLLMDVAMPGMNGIEAMRRIHADEEVALGNVGDECRSNLEVAARRTAAGRDVPRPPPPVLALAPRSLFHQDSP